jgi:hypothetical protein
MEALKSDLALNIKKIRKAQGVAQGRLALDAHRSVSSSLLGHEVRALLEGSLNLPDLANGNFIA